MYFDFKIFEGLFGTKDLLYKYQSEQHKAHVSWSLFLWGDQQHTNKFIASCSSKCC